MCLQLPLNCSVKKKKPIDKQSPGSYHITALFSQFSFHLLKETVMQLVDMLDLLQRNCTAMGNCYFCCKSPALIPRFCLESMN